MKAAATSGSANDGSKEKATALPWLFLFLLSFS